MDLNAGMKSWAVSMRIVIPVLVSVLMDVYHTIGLGVILMDRFVAKVKVMNLLN